MIVIDSPKARKQPIWTFQPHALIFSPCFALHASCSCAFYPLSCALLSQHQRRSRRGARVQSASELSSAILLSLIDIRIHSTNVLNENENLCCRTVFYLPRKGRARVVEFHVKRQVGLVENRSPSRPGLLKHRC